MWKQTSSSKLFLGKFFPFGKKAQWTLSQLSLAVEIVLIPHIPHWGAASYLCTIPEKNQLLLWIIHFYLPQNCCENERIIISISSFKATFIPLLHSQSWEAEAKFTQSVSETNC